MDNTNNIEQRLAYLEKEKRSRIRTLEVVRELGGFQESINRIKDPSMILEKCRNQVEKIIQVKSLAFYLVDEDSSDFALFTCFPESEKASIQSELEHFIDDGTFSRAVLEKKPITAASKDYSDHFLFHVLATVSRVRGMSVAVLDGKDRDVQEAAFELLSILMTHCANALESYDLYNQLRSANVILEEKVTQLSRSQAFLKNEVNAHKTTLEALTESETKYRLLAETAKDMIMTVSQKGKILYINNYGLSLGGFALQDLKGTQIDEILESGDGELIRFDESKPRVEHAFLKAKSDLRVALELSIVPISIPDEGSGALIIGRDISDRLRAEAEKKDLEERLWQARKMESIGLLAGGTAHDFNNLLSIIFSYTDLAGTVLPNDHPATGYLEQVITASKEAKALAQKLYTIGREDKHETHLLDMNVLIGKTIKLLSGSIGKTLNLDFRSFGEPLMVKVEETRVRQVLMNLITNAAHVMETGTIEVGGERVSIELEPELTGLGIKPGQYIRIWVKDTGPGISAEVLPHIFEPYFSTKKDGSNAGLGLAVAHGIIRNYMGAIEVESIPSRGTIFYIFLPEAIQASTNRET
ncbi:MAG: ATP-binding protein [Desulfobacterales bacterium]|nr:ATP-binding protein [Desulfobacterales bacterium]